jgi:WD40 repeat protein
LLQAPEDIACFQINPYDSNMIIAGCVDGQIVLWDITDYQEKLGSTRKTENDMNSSTENSQSKHAEIPALKYCVVSSIESSHKNAVTDIQWLPKHYEVRIINSSWVTMES